MLLEMESDPAALKIPPPWPFVPAEPCLRHPELRRPGRLHPPSRSLPAATLFRMRHRGERHLAAGVQDPAPVAGGAAVLDRQFGDRHLAAEDLEDPIQVVAVDDGTGGALPLDGEIARDVQVAGGGGVLPGTGDRQRERAAGQDDGVGAPSRSAAWMAERSEMWPVASLPLFRFTATVSSVVLTRNVESNYAVFEPLEPGPEPRHLVACQSSVESTCGTEHQTPLERQKWCPLSDETGLGPCRRTESR